MSPESGVRKRIAEAQAVRDVVEGQSNSSSHCGGGIRRRVADNAAGFGAKNPLIDPLKLKWSKGKVSAKDVEDIIGGATAQGASQSRTSVSWRHPAVHVGVHSYHIWRQVSSTALSRERPRLWESSVRGDVGAAERYWDELQESEVLRDHPELLTEDKEWFIPCGLYGDAGQFSHNDSLIVISLNSLIGSGATKNQLARSRTCALAHWTACSA